ncbi:hypothetical protein [Nocardia asteroides]|uniref:hypothetical protein n=1 Tax=Nocardia asteroides TaxID=1824 RepID=UPI001E5991C1|nr:hypothetical protein [Nocardia asteroides]UGT60291.1 hypothetical protein LTT61_24265 [Nocardia asteroides]
MTIDQNNEDDVTALARRVERARGRLAYQFDPALTQALSEDELRAERELAERIRIEERGQRWKEVQAAASASDRARQTTEAIEKADMRDLLLARRAIAAQRRESSPHAKLASLYRHRAWSLRALAGVVTAGMLWSAVNVQQNIAPGGPSDPLFWFSYLLEAMISACLIIIMIGTNKVAEWGVIDNRRQVLAAEAALLLLTVSLNTYPYVRLGNWYDAAVHAVAPVMIGVALLIHDAVSARYGLAIARATAQVRDLPDATDQIRLRMPGAYRGSAITELGRPPIDEPAALPPMAEGEYEVVEEDELPPEDPDNDPDAAEQPDEDERTELTGGAEGASAFRSPNQPARQPVTAELAEVEEEAAEEPKNAPAKRTKAVVKATKPVAATPQRAADEVAADDAPTGVIPAIDAEADVPVEPQPAKPARKTAAKAARPAAKTATRTVAAKQAPVEEAAPAVEEQPAPKPAAKVAPAATVRVAAEPAAVRSKPTAVPEPAPEPAAAEPVVRPAAARVAEPIAAPAAQPAAARSAQPAAVQSAQPAAARSAQPAAARSAQPAAAARSARPAAAARSAQPAAAARSAQPARVAQPAARAAGQGRSAAAAQPVSRQATARATAPVEVPEADRPAAPVISFASKAAARPTADLDPIMMPIEPTPSRPRSSGPRTGPLAAVGRKKKAPEPEPAPIPATSDVYDTGALRVADMLEQELAELREKRRQARAAGRSSRSSSSRDY